MKTADFDYTLPPELIAQFPAERRDASKMMVVNRVTGTFEHKTFADLPDYLRRGDLVVLNNTRVIPARIHGKKAGTGGKAELLFLEERGLGVWDVLLRSRRRPEIGGEIILGDGQARAILLAEGELGRATVRIESAVPVMALLDRFGEPPLPPYIQRVSGVEGRGEDKERYQTVYAKHPGAVAAPTAGLHFTPEIFERLAEKGVDRAEVTLHVGIGTFRPVSAENVEDHRMEAERFEVSEDTAIRIAETKKAGGRIVAVGSTAVRTLESCAPFLPNVGKREGRTDLFITPPFEFRMVDAMLTNFHLPKSTLIMMVSALAGRQLILRAYQEAIRAQYRFFSYGDCMLIL